MDDSEERAHAAGCALELTSNAYLVVEPDLREDIEEYSLSFALDVKGYLQAVRRAASEIEKQVDTYVAAQLQPAIYYCHRDSIVKVGGSGAWKVKEEPVNSGELAMYVGDDWITSVNLKAQGALTVTRLEELEVKRLRQLMKPDAEPSEESIKMAKNVIRQHFFEYKRNENAISVMRPEDAPKYAQALPAGERYIPKPKKPTKPRLEAGE